jgi:hypothetical protein
MVRTTHSQSTERLVHGRIDEAADFIVSTNSFPHIILDEAPASQDLRNTFSQALVANCHITKVTLVPRAGASTQEMMMPRKVLSMRESIRLIAFH